MNCMVIAGVCIGLSNPACSLSERIRSFTESAARPPPKNCPPTSNHANYAQATQRLALLVLVCTKSEAH